jgi:putative membrane protein
VIGQHGDPPRTQRLDYGLVLLQLLWLAFCVSAWQITPLGLSVFGIAVSIFIAFRNTQAIDHWWEARSLWGTLVNHGCSTLSCATSGEPTCAAASMVCWPT